MSGNEDRKILAAMIIEVLGRPKEHLIETLEDLSRQVGEEKGIKIIQKKINEPTLVKDQKDLFTSFAEIEFEVDEPLLLAILMFKYMPSHIEVVEPEKFVLTNVELSDILNELTRRLHRYEELVKVMQFQMQSNGMAGASQIQMKKDEPSKKDSKPKNKKKPSKKKSK